jgi:hypothetical protein
MISKENLSEDEELESVEEEEREEGGEVIIDQLKYLVNISKLWHSILHGDLPLESLIVAHGEVKLKKPKTKISKKEAKKKVKKSATKKAKKSKSRK